MTIKEFEELDALVTFATNAQAWERRFGKATLQQVLAARFGRDKLEALAKEQQSARIRCRYQFAQAKVRRDCSEQAPVRVIKKAVVHRKNGSVIECNLSAKRGDKCYYKKAVLQGACSKKF